MDSRPEPHWSLGAQRQWVRLREQTETRGNAPHNNVGHFATTEPTPMKPKRRAETATAALRKRVVGGSNPSAGTSPDSQFGRHNPVVSRSLGPRAGLHS